MASPNNKYKSYAPSTSTTAAFAAMQPIATVSGHSLTVPEMRASSGEGRLRGPALLNRRRLVMAEPLRHDNG